MQVGWDALMDRSKPFSFSDRYKIFIDLFNLASFLIPREFIPKLTDDMKVCLSVASVEATEEHAVAKS